MKKFSLPNYDNTIKRLVVDPNRVYNANEYENSMFNLKYGAMSIKSFDFIESNFSKDDFKLISIIPITIKINYTEQMYVQGMLDSGSSNSFIDVYVAKEINAVIIDNLITTGITSITENKPVAEILISNESMDKKWFKIKVGIIDTHHPNVQIILGRDFMEEFNEINFDYKNKKTILNY